LTRETIFVAFTHDYPALVGLAQEEMQLGVKEMTSLICQAVGSCGMNGGQRRWALGSGLAGPP